MSESGTPAPDLPAAGWYPDPDVPSVPGSMRYWDGAAWALPIQPPVAPRRRRGLVVTLVVVFGLLVAGAGGAVALVQHNRTTPAASATHVSGGTKVSGKGVSVTLPTGWTNVPTSPDQFAKYLDLAAKNDPQMAKQLSEQMRSATSNALVMFAVRSSDQGSGFVTNVNLGVSPGDGLDAAAGVQPIKNQLEAAGAENTVVILQPIAGRDALFATYDLHLGTSGVVVHGAEFTVLGPNQIAFLAVTTTGPDAAAAAEQIAATITFG